MYTNKEREREKNNSEYLAEHHQMKSIFSQDDHNSGTPGSCRPRGPIPSRPDRLSIRGLNSGSHVGTPGRQTSKIDGNIQRGRLDSFERDLIKKGEKLDNFSSPFVGQREGYSPDGLLSVDRHRQTIKNHSLLSKISVENKLAGNRPEA